VGAGACPSLPAPTLFWPLRDARLQAATCGVSRSSLLTGRRPDTTEVLSNGLCPFTVNPKHRRWYSLPSFFRSHGYTTAGMGKIFHPNVCEGAAVGEQAAAWSRPYYHAPCISLGSIYNSSCFEDYPDKLPGGGKKITSAYANSTGRDEDTPDGMIAQHAVDTLKQLVQHPDGNPFFVAVGFREWSHGVNGLLVVVGRDTLTLGAASARRQTTPAAHCSAKILRLVSS
jgi:iduronate 2-sulfatase